MVLINEQWKRQHLHRLGDKRPSQQVLFFEGTNLIGTGYTRPKYIRPIYSIVYMCTLCGDVWGRVLIDDACFELRELPCRSCDTPTTNSGQGHGGLFDKHSLFAGLYAGSLDGIEAPPSVYARDFLHLMELHKI